MNNKVKVAVCQFKIGVDKQKNIEKAKNYINKSASLKANIIVLPECFVCPYDINTFKNYAEKITYKISKTDTPAFYMLKNASEENRNTYIFGGSIIEEDVHGNLYNTCLVFYNGILKGKYRKINLYKIMLTEHQFSEGDVLKPGQDPVIINTIYGKIGIGICYDIRFGDLAKKYMLNNCKLIIYPGSFNRITGPKHWKILQQVRALDNQLFVVSCSSACSFGSSFESYGKSFIVSPFGEIIGETILDREEIMCKDIHLDSIESTRASLPILPEKLSQ